MQKLIFLLILFIQVNVFSQKKKIIVLDSITNNPIPFASLEYYNTTVGIFANEFGEFEVDSRAKRVVVKSLGYFDKIIEVENIDKIYLKPKILDLKEVIIYNYGEEVLLEKQKSKSMIPFRTNSGGLTFARLFKETEKTSLRKVFLSIENDSTPKKILLEIYTVDKNDLPSKNILDEKIIANIEPNQKNLEIDLTEDLIILSDNKYFLAITILNFKNSASNVKLGFKQSKDKLTLFKPYFKKNQSWGIIPNYKENRFLNLNMSISIAPLL